MAQDRMMAYRLLRQRDLLLTYPRTIIGSRPLLFHYKLMALLPT